MGVVGGAPVALGLAQFGPTRAAVNGAVEALGIDEIFHHEHRVIGASLPIVAQRCQHAAEYRRLSLGTGPVGQ